MASIRLKSQTKYIRFESQVEFSITDLSNMQKVVFQPGVHTIKPPTDFELSDSNVKWYPHDFEVFSEKKTVEFLRLSKFSIVLTNNAYVDLASYDSVEIDTAGIADMESGIISPKRNYQLLCFAEVFVKDLAAQKNIEMQVVQLTGEPAEDVYYTKRLFCAGPAGKYYALAPIIWHGMKSTSTYKFRITELGTGGLTIQWVSLNCVLIGY